MRITYLQICSESGENLSCELGYPGRSCKFALPAAPNPNFRNTMLYSINVVYSIIIEYCLHDNESSGPTVLHVLMLNVLRGSQWVPECRAQPLMSDLIGIQKGKERPFLTRASPAALVCARPWWVWVPWCT